jgi:hypothetical protein
MFIEGGRGGWGKERRIDMDGGGAEGAEPVDTSGSAAA